jgi:hypothetical protein
MVAMRDLRGVYVCVVVVSGWVVVVVVVGGVGVVTLIFGVEPFDFSTTASWDLDLLGNVLGAGVVVVEVVVVVVEVVVVEVDVVVGACLVDNTLGGWTGSLAPRCFADSFSDSCKYDHATNLWWNVHWV